jgi:hypothetical protein
MRLINGCTKIGPLLVWKAQPPCLLTLNCIRVVDDNDADLLIRRYPELPTAIPSPVRASSLAPVCAQAKKTMVEIISLEARHIRDGPHSPGACREVKTETKSHHYPQVES